MAGEPANSAWQVIYTAVGLPTAVAAISLVQWFFTRRDKQTEGYRIYRDQIAADLKAERSQLSTDQSALFDRMEKSLARETLRCESLEKTIRDLERTIRDVEQDVRDMEDRLLQYRSLAAEAQQMVQSLQRTQGLAVTKFDPLPPSTPMRDDSTN